MRILYLSYDGLTDPLGQSQILPYLQGLSKIGYKIDIVSFEKPERWRLMGPEITEVCRLSGLTYYPRQYRKWPPIISTLLDIWQMKRTAAKLHREEPYQLIHCRSYIPAMVGDWMKRKFNVKFIFDMRGFYADERVDGNIWPQNNPVYRLVFHYFKSREKNLLRQADHIISLTESAKNIISSWGYVDTAKGVAVIPCCVDLDHFDPKKVDSSDRAELIQSMELNDNHPVVGYVGSTGTWYLLRDMLHYFSILKSKYPEAVMVFLTLDKPETIYQPALEMGIPKKALRIKAVGRKELPLHISLFDWSVFFIQPVFSKTASSPTKQGELMSMGIPIVCNAGVGDTEKIIEQYNAGFSVANTSPSELEKAVSASPQLLQPDRDSIFLGAKQYFSLEKGIEKLDRIYAALDK